MPDAAPTARTSSTAAHDPIHVVPLCVVCNATLLPTRFMDARPDGPSAVRTPVDRKFYAPRGDTFPTVKDFAASPAFRSCR